MVAGLGMGIGAGQQQEVVAEGCMWVRPKPLGAGQRGSYGVGAEGGPWEPCGGCLVP